MISDAAVGHIVVDIVVADPTHRDLMERAAGHCEVFCNIFVYY